MGLKTFAAAVILLAGPTLAQDTIPVETGVNGSSLVTLHVHPFLRAEELAVLRLVLTRADALELFVEKTTGFAAVAVSPDDGFMRGDGLVASAKGFGEFADAAGARTAALAACDAAREGQTPCVVVLDVAPTQ